MDPCGNHHRDMQDLVACTEIVKSIWNPSFRNLYTVSCGWHRFCKSLFLYETYPCRVDGCSDEVGRSHPSHPDQRHARLLQFPSMDEEPMGDKNDGTETKACIETGTHFSELRRDKGRSEGKDGAAERRAGCLFAIVSDQTSRQSSGEKVVIPLSSTPSANCGCK